MGRMMIGHAGASAGGIRGSYLEVPVVEGIDGQRQKRLFLFQINLASPFIPSLIGPLYLQVHVHIPDELFPILCSSCWWSITFS